MENAISLIWVAVVLIFVFTKASKFKKFTKNAKAKGINPQEFVELIKANSEMTRQTVKKKGHNYKPYKAKPSGMKIHREPKGGTPILFEDREHDWLAKQLREEAQVMRRGDFLDLGANHNAHCDARTLKLMHMLQHDDSIDRGEL